MSFADRERIRAELAADRPSYRVGDPQCGHWLTRVHAYAGDRRAAGLLILAGFDDIDPRYLIDYVGRLWPPDEWARAWTASWNAGMSSWPQMAAFIFHQDQAGVSPSDVLVRALLDDQRPQTGQNAPSEIS